MPFTVTRQRQWPEGTPVVEVSAGGIDYTNPDALVQRYAGEFETFDDPRKAVAVAIAICKSWRKDGERRARIGHGATGGMTMPFDPCTFAQAMAWAERKYAELPLCDRCGAVLGDTTYSNGDLDLKFCSEYCAERGSKP